MSYKIIVAVNNKTLEGKNIKISLKNANLFFKVFNENIFYIIPKDAILK